MRFHVLLIVALLLTWFTNVDAAAVNQAEMKMLKASAPVRARRGFVDITRPCGPCQACGDCNVNYNDPECASACDDCANMCPE
uniref:Ubs_13 putative toxin n=1 Tax=Unedogemmula bisaya TaxID=746885 RepID=A0A098LXZ7_UNEBI